MVFFNKSRNVLASLLCLTLMTLLPLGAFAQASSFKPVVVAQYNFDDGKLNGWTTRGGVGFASISADMAHSGTSSLVTKGRTADGHMARIELTGVLERGAKYRIELYARLQKGAKAATMNMTGLNRYSDHDDEIALGKPVDINDSAWTLCTGEFLFEATALSYYYYTGIKDNDTADYYIDDIAVTKISEKTEAPAAKLESFTYDFEKNANQGWGPRGTVSVGTQAKAAHSGALGLEASGRGETWSGPALQLKDTLKQGAIYTITGWIKLPSAPSAPSTVKLTMEEKSSDGKTNWKTIGQATVSDTGWVKLSGSYTFTVPMDGLSLYAESSSASDVIYIDDVSIDMTVAVPVAAPPAVQKDLLALKDRFAGKFAIGAAVSPSSFTGVSGEMLVKHYDSIVAENAMKPLYIQPAEGTFFWEDADKIVAFAKKNGMEMRYHTLLWHSQVPAWFFLDANGKEMTDEKDPAKQAVNKALLLKRIETHIAAVVTRYKNNIRSWDVVNEVIDSSESDGLRHSKWYLIAGKDYIETAFRAARKAGGSDIKLYMTDYSTDNPAKRDAMLKIVKELLAKGVPIDGIGHQTHVSLDSPSVKDISDSIRLFASLGLDNQITELDLSVYTDNTTAYSKVPADLLARQGYRYKEIFDAFVSLQNEISSVTFWGIADNYTWLTNRPITRKDAPFVFDDSYQAKAGYWGLVDATKLPPEPAAPKPLVEPKQGEAGFGTIVVDGKIDVSWNDERSMFLRVIAAGKPDAFAKVRVKWDTGFLYVLMEVTDSVLDNKSKNDYEKDSVEVYLDENNAKATAYDKDDAQYRVTFENVKSFGSNGADPKFASAVIVGNSGYLVEMAIPFRTVKPAADMIVGFDAQINDGDGNGVRKGILKWNDSTDSSYKSALNWGEMKLVK